MDINVHVTRYSACKLYFIPVMRWHIQVGFIWRSYGIRDRLIDLDIKENAILNWILREQDFLFSSLNNRHN
jgi:hypothetical protein